MLVALVSVSAMLRDDTTMVPVMWSACDGGAGIAVVVGKSKGGK